MRIFDCHAHIGSCHDGISGHYIECSESSLVAQMDAAGVDKAVVSHLGALQDAVQANGDMLAAAQRHNGRFIPLAWVAPGEVTLDDLHRMLLGGFKGLKLHPTAGKFRADCDEAVDFLRLCGDLGMPALIHCAADEWSAPHLVASAAARAAASGAGVRVIAAHMNLMGDAEEAILAAEETPNMYLDTSWARPEDVLEAIGRLGASRILWGTDAPLAGLGPDGGHYAKDRVRGAILHHLPQEQAEMILWGNTQRIFDLDVEEVR